MIKRILLACIIMSTVFIAQAQFHIGAKVGTNISKIAGRSFTDEYNYSYLAGGFAEIGFGDKLSINPEVLFNQTSATYSTDYKDIYQDIIKSDQRKAKLNYLSIPLLVNYRLFGPLHVEAGPQFSKLMSSDKNLINNGKEAFKSGDFSFVGGVQFKISSFRVWGRYVVGLNNINDIDKRDKWRQQAIQVALGYAL